MMKKIIGLILSLIPFALSMQAETRAPYHSLSSYTTSNTRQALRDKKKLIEKILYKGDDLGMDIPELMEFFQKTWNEKYGAGFYEKVIESMVQKFAGADYVTESMKTLCNYVSDEFKINLILQVAETDSKNIQKVRNICNRFLVYNKLLMQGAILYQGLKQKKVEALSLLVKWNLISKGVQVDVLKDFYKHDRQNFRALIKLVDLDTKNEFHRVNSQKVNQAKLATNTPNGESEDLIKGDEHKSNQIENLKKEENENKKKATNDPEGESGDLIKKNEINNEPLKKIEGEGERKVENKHTVLEINEKRLKFRGNSKKKYRVTSNTQEERSTKRGDNKIINSDQEKGITKGGMFAYVLACLSIFLAI